MNQDVRLEYLEEDEMKKRIGSAIAGVSLLICCVCVGTGCTPALGYVTIDWGSSVMQPTFCMYRDPYFQEPLSIGSIEVNKIRHFSDEKKQWKDFQTVWQLKYESSDNFMRKLSTSPVFCLTYGEVPRLSRGSESRPSRTRTTLQRWAGWR